eukprot:TRINITY_DN5017_c0_g1_i3.p1 TRINITY_DN5017_c0_g1~~TRINITY_DN5017_c0_g1_i3.p1  ORF type:complete len:278 (-),score=95.55 TRINITY_DN5017_c0_g1_i3:285-1118(-)
MVEKYKGQLKGLESSSDWNKELYNYIDEQRQMIENYEKELKSLKDTAGSFKVLEAQLNTSKSQCATYRQAIEDYERQLETYRNQLITLRAKNDELRKNAEHCEEPSVKEEVWARDFQDMIDKAEEENRLLKFQQENVLKKEILELHSSVSKLYSEVVELKSGKGKLEIENNTLRQRINELNAENTKESKKGSELERCLSEIRLELSTEKQKSNALKDNIRLMEEIVSATKGELELLTKRKDDINLKRIAELQKDRDVLALKAELNKTKVFIACDCSC